MSLHPCSACGRHVRRTETACPFCAATISFEGVAERGVPAQRLGRAATFAFGAAVTVGASALTGCTSSPAPAYGAPPVDAHVEGDAFATDAFVGGFDAAYGGPPIDAAEVDAGPTEVDAATEQVDADAIDAGSAALYGAPPP